MTKKVKPTRIITDREHIDKQSVEYIEIDEYGTIWWKTQDFFGPFLHALKNEVSDQRIDELIAIYPDHIIEAGFPVDLQFVRDYFQARGREFDQSKLPPHTSKFHPYNQWM